MNYKKLHEYNDRIAGYIDSISRAIMNGEPTYSLALEGDEGYYLRTIKLPTPQRAGTETQKRDYARMKAQELIEEYKQIVNRFQY